MLTESEPKPTERGDARIGSDDAIPSGSQRIRVLAKREADMGDFMRWRIRDCGTRLLLKTLRIAAPIVLIATTATIVTVSSPAGADSASFTSSEIGSSGNTPSFDQSGPWTMAWNYDCSGAFGGTGNFIVNVNGSSVRARADRYLSRRECRRYL